MRFAQAVNLLLACRPLLEKLKAQGIYARLDQADFATLAGYMEVFQAGLTENQTLREEVEISSEDLALLSFSAATHSNEIEVYSTPPPPSKAAQEEG